MIPQWMIDEYKNVTKLIMSRNTIILGDNIRIVVKEQNDDVCRGELSIKISKLLRMKFKYYHVRGKSKSIERISNINSPISMDTFVENIDLYREQVLILKDEDITGLLFNITAVY